MQGHETDTLVTEFSEFFKSCELIFHQVLKFLAHMVPQCLATLRNHQIFHPEDFQILLLLSFLTSYFHLGFFVCLF